jgi:hypothetical protein
MPSMAQSESGLQKVKSLSPRLTEMLINARSRTLGLEVKFSSPEVDVIRSLDIIYSSHELRYIAAGTVRVPPLAQLALAAERPVRGLEKYCTATAGRGG